MPSTKEMLKIAAIAIVAVAVAGGVTGAVTGGVAGGVAGSASCNVSTIARNASIFVFQGAWLPASLSTLNSAARSDR